MSEETRVTTNDSDEEGTAVLTDRKQLWRVVTESLVEATSEDEAIAVEAKGGAIELVAASAEPVEDQRPDMNCPMCGRPTRWAGLWVACEGQTCSWAMDRARYDRGQRR